jgi:hypothetical protein
MNEMVRWKKDWKVRRYEVHTYIYDRNEEAKA